VSRPQPPRPPSKPPRKPINTKPVRHFSMWALPAWVAPYAVLIAAIDHTAWVAWLDRLPTT
jgi:hypothetical protein